MDIERSYIHSSHSDTTPSGYYAGGHTIRNSTFNSLVSKEQQEPHLTQEEPISTPIPQQASITSPPSIIHHARLTSLKQDGHRTTVSDDEQHSQTTRTATSAYLPSMYLARRDKRKSSPAVLGLLGLGEEQEAKLGEHLSLHRNSIEAAMLLANFNRPQTKPSSPVLENKEATWKDTLSVGSNPDKKTNSFWEGTATPASTHQRPRRYSFDSKMSWESMSKQFLDQASLLQELKVKPIKLSSITTSSSSLSSSSAISSPRIKSKTWYSESMEQEQKLQQGYHEHYPGQSFHPPSGTVYHTIYSSNQPLLSNDQRQLTPMQQQQPGYYPYPQQHYYFPGKIPLSTNTTPTEDNNNNGMMMMHPYHPHHVYPPMVPPHLHPLHPTQHHPYHLQHLHQQSQAMAAAATAAPTVKPKRKRRDQAEGDETLDQVMPGDADFPDMAERDVEAARNDVEARPRRQKLRYIGDMYTPQWVRYNGQSKEGLCDTCKPGKWLQLKNSAFWYHKQFFHGISSVSGAEFMKPMDTRWVDQDIVEGLCHQCQQWVSVSNVKRKNSVLWYRHAHKCHVYHKPKNGSPKTR
ncbi:hypothetical protein BCR42DRAFT_454916 [Absidia repens]|uniref:Transcription regulator Rua1 C-terminal domain-containing protein n=1 Tax=Absidia repens TaxID=90262 RepID=A0A1X2I5U8_9FUNG|nr:hypothetical protein BCR42DRAFT_454916 [Absidia repens]